MHRFVVPLLCMLVFHVAAQPYQCIDLTSIIPACHCEARVFKGLVYNTQVVINCRNLNLSSVPEIKGRSDHVIFELTLAQNNIQTIPAAAFNGLRIERLDLTKNRLTSINNNSFHGLENDLKELYLGAENGAGVVPPIGSVIPLTNLNTLHLEYFAFQRNGISPGVLNILTGLTTLTLRYSQLGFLDPLSLPTSLTTLTLDHQSLTSFPVDALRSLTQLESLTITNTPLSALYRNSLEMNTKLTHLDLSDNQITTLSDGCFNGITRSLLTLSLRKNPLASETNLNEIKQLTALTELYLSSTGLSSVSNGANFLLNKPSLTILHLDKNALPALGRNVFNNLGNLKELNLAWNQLSSLDGDVFAGLSSLQSLDLGHQSGGQTLTLPKSLTTLTSLQTLRLSKTTVDSSVLWSRISTLDSLHFLFLDSTSLPSIPDYAFRNLTQLKELNLNNNDLTEITQAMLAGPRGLETLALNKNKITTLSHCSFYNFTFSKNLSLELIDNPLACDCKLKWLLEERNRRITLTGGETCGSPPDKSGQHLLRYNPQDFTCLSVPSEEPCLELYTTTAPPVTTSPPSLGLGITIDNVNTTSISISWTLADFPSVSHFKILHMDLGPSESVLSEKIDARDRSYKLTGLKPSTQYSVCVFAYISSTGNEEHVCSTTITLDGRSPQTDDPSSVGSSPSPQSDDPSSEIGIIVGTVVGVLVLLAIMAAIVYLLCFRKRRSQEVPPQPHEFKPSELPSMSANSRQFTKPKEKPPPKVGRALDGNIKVTVISDGQTAPVSPRHSVGSYQFLDGQHPNPNPELTPANIQNYSNDVDNRPLPTAPDRSFRGYYNGGINPAHSYNEIENK